MAGGGGQQPSQPENSAAILWIVGAVLIVVGLIWYIFKRAIIHFYFSIKLLEIDVVSLFTNQLDDVRTVILSSDPGKLTFQQVTAIGSAVGDYIRIPLVLLVLVFGFVIFFANSTRVFKRIYSMKDLVQLEKGMWPQINPVANLDLIKTDIDKGPWAMALTPMQFCKRHHLLDVSKRPPQEGLTHRERNQLIVKLRRGQANKLFALQVGALWPANILRLPPHVKALFAAFAARANADTQVALDLFKKINISSGGKLDFSGVDELCKKYENTKLVHAVTSSHAYLLTVMAEMLNLARTDGVQGSADFLWLKPLDRKLWYMLNTVGRQTPFVEVAGPFAHWLAEKEIGRKLVVPIIEEATNALEIAVKEILYRPDDDETIT